MATIARRRFRLIEVMILVAATAVGCAMIQGIDRSTNGELSWSGLGEYCQDCFENGLTAYAVGKFLVELILLAQPLLIAWTIALIPIRLIGSGTRLHRLARQPGLTASCATGVSIVFVMLIICILQITSGSNWEEILESMLSIEFILFGSVTIGVAIAAAWTTLLVGRRWRAEASWIDRLGRVLGVFWIVAGLVTMVVYYLAMSSCFSTTGRSAKSIPVPLYGPPAFANPPAFVESSTFVNPPAFSE